MEEAEKLCGLVGIMDNGKISVLNNPQNLIAQTGLDSTIEFRSGEQDFKAIIQNIGGINKFVRQGNKGIIYTQKSSLMFGGIALFVEKNNKNIEDTPTRRVTLEDVFLYLTGKKLKE